MRTIRNLQPKGKTILVRVDFNVPLGKAGNIADDFRIQMALPTIRHLLDKGGRVILMSHLGRPNGKDAKLSLRPIAQHLARLLKQRVFFFSSYPGERESITALLSPGTLLMLENLRFWQGEERNDPRFAKCLAAIGDAYVNDAFAVSHRKAASLVAITRYLPSYAGFLLEREMKNLDRISDAKQHPFGVILGGGKVEDKFPLIELFLKKADWVFVGGGLANTFLWAKGFSVGHSLKGNSYLQKAKKLLTSKKLILPIDWRTGKAYGSRTARYYCAKDIPKSETILDIGLATTAVLEERIAKSKMLLWNGPVGYFENTGFAYGSREIAKLIVANHRSFSVAGGGDTVDLIRGMHLEKEFSFVSTGGGAMIDYLAGKKLPGIEALR